MNGAIIPGCECQMGRHSTGESTDYIKLLDLFIYWGPIYDAIYDLHFYTVAPLRQWPTKMNK